MKLKKKQSNENGGKDDGQDGSPKLCLKIAQPFINQFVLNLSQNVCIKYNKQIQKCSKDDGQDDGPKTVSFYNSAFFNQFD